MNRRVVVVSAVRTAIGTFGGALKDIPHRPGCHRRARSPVRAASVRRRGQARGVRPCGQHRAARHVPLARGRHRRRLRQKDAGLQRQPPVRLGPAGHRVPAQAITLGDCDIAIGAGAENMSRAPFASPHQPLGRAHGRRQARGHDGRRAARPFHNIHMGVTAENIAAKWGITRDDQDQLAVESHQRAERATRRAASGTRSCRSCRRPARATWPSTPTSISAPTAAPPTWPSSSRCSSRRTAP